MLKLETLEKKIELKKRKKEELKLEQKIIEKWTRLIVLGGFIVIYIIFLLQ